MHISHTKSFNMPFSIELATLAHMINVYEIWLNTTNYPIFNMQDFRYCLWTSILDCFWSVGIPTMIEKYANSLSYFGHWFKFLLNKPHTLFALPVTYSIWRVQLKSLQRYYNKTTRVWCAISLSLGWRRIGSGDPPPPQTKWYWHTAHQTKVVLYLCHANSYSFIYPYLTASLRWQN